MSVPRPGRAVPTVHRAPRGAPLLAVLLALLFTACAPPRPHRADPENFLWVFGRLYRDTVVYRNLLAFAERHDLSIVLAPASVTQTPEQLEAIDHALVAAKASGRPVLFNTGVFKKEDGWPTGPELLADSAWRARYRETLATAAGVYLRRFPGGRVIVGHEDPLFSNWPAGDDRAYREHGADMFRLQRSVVREVDPGARVGMFVLPSHVLRMYRAFMHVLAEDDALPDFSIIDRYRGYSDPSDGLDRTNAETREMLTAARRLTGGAPVYYLGEDHTINTGYTPSRRAITGNVGAALDAGVAGVGWYIRTRYVPTAEVATLRRTVRPFLPNEGSVDEKRFNTFTGARDRFMFAYLSTLERQGRIDPEARFDLWIHGTDLDLHEAALFLRDVDGEWRYIGDIGTYVGGDNARTLDGRTGAVIFHALDRAVFLDPNAADSSHVLQARLVAERSEDGLGILGLYALPYTPVARYVTEGDAAAQLAEPAAVRARSLAFRSWDTNLRLAPGDTLDAHLNREDTWTSGE